MTEPPKTIGVAGAGTMGAGIAQVCLVAGYPVLLHDAAAAQLEVAQARIRRGLEIQAAKGQIPSAEEVLGRPITIIRRIPTIWSV